MRADQLAEAARVAQLRWPETWRPCEDPNCPCEKTGAGDDVG